MNTQTKPQTNPSIAKLTLGTRPIKVDYKKLYNAIDYDLGQGYYKQFPIVESQMKVILSKLNKLMFVTNANPLSNVELQTLKDNDYIRF